MASSDKVVDNMGRRGVAAGAAEPFIARETFDNATGVVDSAVPRKSSILVSVI